MQTPSNIKVIIDSNPSRIDIKKVRIMLADAFWCPKINEDEIKKGMKNSALIVGAYTDTGEQVGFLRVISDKTRFAYLLDVIVDKTCRRKGIGRKMVSYALRHEELKDVYQWLLLTRDAHGVYDKLGFAPLDKPECWMMINKGRPDRSAFRF